jgi:branched-chain amino acid transport system ATP-binding protein
MQALLDVQNVTKQFGGLTAVQNVTFEVRQGEILGLIGPNGAGKTTIFNLVTGFYAPTTGEIYFKGQRISKPPIKLSNRVVNPLWWLSWLPVPALQERWKNYRILRPHEITQSGIARTFQAIRLFKNMTALENIMAGPHHRTAAGIMGALLQTSAQRKEEIYIVREADRLLRFMGLEEYRNELAKNLPYGDQRRLEIARALATSPSLLTLDEPAAGLNDQETHELVNLIREIRDTGVTVLLIEHDMKMVMGLCERIVVIDHGSKIAEGSPYEIQQNQDVINAYLGVEDF